MINKILNNTIKCGNKSISMSIIRKSFILIKNKKPKSNLIELFKKGFSNIQPKISFKNKKIAGVVHKVPKPYQNITKTNLSSKWIVANSRKRSELKYKDRFSNELFESISKKSLSFKNKINIHKLGLSNRTNIKYM